VSHEAESVNKLRFFAEEEKKGDLGRNGKRQERKTWNDKHMKQIFVHSI
jgi:hypothetical protein